MSDDICRLSPAEEPPVYVQEKPVRDISAAATNPEQKKEYSKVDITQDWPPAPVNSLDDTQWEALKQMLTKRLAIVQGPPGTGKTFVSRVAVEILHANRQADDPPIIIAAQTNHALDQLLSHISVFEPNYIRLGGRSTKLEVKKRAFYLISIGFDVSNARLAAVFFKQGKRRRSPHFAQPARDHRDESFHLVFVRRFFEGCPVFF